MPEPKQDRAIRTREEIIRAAAEVFDERGYNGASMREIMKRAGVTLGAVYFHFPNKEAIAREVMNSQPDTILPRLTSQGLQQVVDITLVWSRQLQSDPTLRAGVRLAVEQSGLDWRDTSSYTAWEKIFEECLLLARERGELLGHVSPRDMAGFLVGACTGVQLYSDLLYRRADLTQRTVNMWELLLPGVAGPDIAGQIKVSVRRASALAG
ncbi:ScbR family autoregulator-binding transcription factor [Streptomyces sp. NBC_01275]|uniref:ScbR family autoregulator-binding transcription factor n=1 Tax=Streptomyces sp. NBC_01275 TaxID=2903807 RepID=UPI002257FB5A|nr:ScbR family autoregulator-binding transcription factor [Streptomyces sp. NBC_01275]MCX4761522.1 ScbR family autoregulator-binding transcription factor [Streptomyces sp. NBC_01275]